MLMLSGRRRRVAVLFLLAVTSALSILSSYLLRFDLALPAQQRAQLPIVILFAVSIKLLVFSLTGLHHGWWRWTDTRDIIRLVGANLIASVTFALLVLGSQVVSVPRSIYVMDFVVSSVLTGGLRMAARITKELLVSNPEGINAKKVLVYGAGAAGVALARELRMNPALKYTVLGFIDDNPSLKGELVCGYRVLGPGQDLARLVSRFRRRGIVPDEVLISMPSATGRQIREAVSHCRAAGLPCKILPGLGGLLEGKGLTGQLREIALEDLLGREPIRLDKAQIMDRLKHQAVMVTGAAGSIGKVLCRQIAVFQPKKLVLVDQNESGLFEIEADLLRKFPNIEIVASLSDIRNGDEIRELFVKTKPDVVFHAAAYKHVPIMELHPLSAVHTNVIGTWNLVVEAERAGVNSVVMISSDKAVNPVNVMGATKRAAELIVSSFSSGDGRLRCVSVRFGNVLGSSGSVVPIFQKQIAEGGPVTVTHPEVRRYFMLTEEAVQLVLQAFTMGKGGEVFVLDMGELIRISDRAANMIRLAGLEPNLDIEIRYTGLRPGEKLYEEVVNDEEQIAPTSHEKIKIFRSSAPARPEIQDWIARVESALRRRDEVEAVSLLRELIPEYEPGELWRDRIRPGKAEVFDS